MVPTGYRSVGQDRVRESAGFTYHEFVVGTVIEHRPGRTVTETDNLLITALTGNTAPIHLDAHYAAGTDWGQPLVCSLVTLAIVGGMTVRSTSGLTLANLGWREIELPAPVFVGDTLYAESVITGKRRSRSRPEVGIVTCRTTGYKATTTPGAAPGPATAAGADGPSGQDGTGPGMQCVLRYIRSFLVPTDEAARDRRGY